MESFDPEVREAEEDFDRSLLDCLRNDVAPLLGDPHVPDAVASRLAWTLLQGSHISGYDTSHSASTTDSVAEGIDRLESEYDASTEHGPLSPKERFSYWCFDILFFICADTKDEAASGTDQKDSWRRLAALSLPYLLMRCRFTMIAHVADAQLRGSLPLAR